MGGGSVFVPVLCPGDVSATKTVGECAQGNGRTIARHFAIQTVARGGGTGCATTGGAEGGTGYGKCAHPRQPVDLNTRPPVTHATGVESNLIPIVYVTHYRGVDTRCSLCRLRFGKRHSEREGRVHSWRDSCVL